MSGYQDSSGRQVPQKGANGAAYVIVVDQDGNPVSGGSGGGSTDITPITDRQGDVVASPGIYTMLGRLKTLTDLFGAISANPAANTVLGRLKDITSALSAPKFTTVTITNLTTAADGTSFVAFGSLACEFLDVFNDTDTALEYRRGTTGLTMIIPPGAERRIYGITNANQIQFKRKDSTTAQVVVRAEAYKI